MKSLVQIGLVILAIFFVMKMMKGGKRCEGFTQQQPGKVACNCNISREGFANHPTQAGTGAVADAAQAVDAAAGAVAEAAATVAAAAGAGPGAGPGAGAGPGSGPDAGPGAMSPVMAACIAQAGASPNTPPTPEQKAAVKACMQKAGPEKLVEGYLSDLSPQKYGTPGSGDMYMKSSDKSSCRNAGWTHQQLYLTAGCTQSCWNSPSCIKNWNCTHLKPGWFESGSDQNPSNKKYIFWTDNSTSVMCG